MTNEVTPDATPTQTTEEKNSYGIRVFVYGTLKKTHPNHYILEATKATLLGRCYIEGPYRMVSLSYHPGVLRYTDHSVGIANRIYGEVYRVSNECLDSLDILEGNGRYFTRSKVLTPWKNAWCYFLPVDAGQDAPPVPAGVWKPTGDEEVFISGKENH